MFLQIRVACTRRRGNWGHFMRYPNMARKQACPGAKFSVTRLGRGVSFFGRSKDSRSSALIELASWIRDCRKIPGTPQPSARDQSLSNADYASLHWPLLADQHLISTCFNGYLHHSHSASNLQPLAGKRSPFLLPARSSCSWRQASVAAKDFSPHQRSANRYGCVAHRGRFSRMGPYFLLL